MSVLQWRPYQPADEDALWALHKQMEARFGRKMDFPQPDGPSILSTIVGERSGVITNAITLETEVECCHIGVNPIRGEEAQAAAKILVPLIQSQGIRIVRSFVPAAALRQRSNRRNPALRDILKAAGMTQETEEMTSWFRWIEEIA